MANISLKDLLKMKEDEIMGVEKRIGEINNKYFDLVWFVDRIQKVTQAH